VQLWTHEVEDWPLPLNLPSLSIKEQSQGAPPSKGGSASGERKTDKPPAERKAQKEEVLSRLLQKLKTYDDALEWIHTCESKMNDDFLLTLLSSVNKTAHGTEASRYCLEVICRREPIWKRLVGIAQFNTFLHKVSKTHDFQTFLVAEYPIYTDEIESDSHWKSGASTIHCKYDGKAKQPNDVAGYLNSLAEAHNRMMHALNGNTSAMEFPDNMGDILAHESVRSIYTERTSAVGKPLADPIREVEQQSGIKNIQGINTSNVATQMPIRGGTVTATNVFTATNDLNHPEALLFPRQVRNGAGAALIASTNRLPLYGVGTVLRHNIGPLVLSAHGASIQQMVARGGNIRPNQTTEFGFYTAEDAGLIRVEGTDNGDSLVSCFTKMMLYNTSLAWQSPVTQLPIGGEVGKFDAFTKIQNAATATLGYNDGNIFGEDCGGALAPVPPYVQAALTVAFHASNQTVPAGRTPFYIRPTLLQQNDRGDNTINFALLAMMLAPAPIGLHTVTIPTQDTAGGNALNQQFIPFSACTHIGGSWFLDFVIPVSGAPNPASTQVTANGNVILQPSAGPTAYGVLLANQFLDVNFIGNPAGYISFPLADYLGSWLALPGSPMDITTISRFCKQVAEITHRGEDLRFATELAGVMAVRYPPLVECVPGTPTLAAVNSALSVAQQNFFALKPHVMAGDVPEEETLYDFYLAELNPMFWNKTMTGVFDPTPDRAVYPLKNYELDGSPRFLQYLTHIVRDYAITAEYIFQYHRQTQAMWNAAFTQSPMAALVNTLRKYFTASDWHRATNAIIKSMAGTACASLHWKVNAEAPAFDMFGCSIWHLINAPRVGFLGVWSAAGVELTTPIPSILPDVWCQLFSRRRGLAFSPFLSPLKKMVGIQVPNAQVTAIGGGGYTVPAPVEGQAREVGLNMVPVISDSEVFNARLVWHTYAADLYSLDNQVWNVSTVASANIVCQKCLTADLTVPNNRSAILPTAKTNWMPYNTDTGLRLLVGVANPATANAMSQVMDGRAFGGLYTWVFNKVTVMPNIIVGTVGNTDDGIWDDESGSDLKGISLENLPNSGVIGSA
jgi:hypothetical protein